MKLQILNYSVTINYMIIVEELVAKTKGIFYAVGYKIFNGETVDIKIY